MASKNTVYLTEEGLKDLKAELDNLINVRRQEVLVTYQKMLIMMLLKMNKHK